MGGTLKTLARNTKIFLGLEFVFIVWAISFLILAIVLRVDNQDNAFKIVAIIYLIVGGILGVILFIFNLIVGRCALKAIKNPEPGKLILIGLVVPIIGIVGGFMLLEDIKVEIRRKNKALNEKLVNI